MKKVIQKTKVGLLYATAHAAHYRAKDLPEALQLYRDVIRAYPDTLESGYARSQIQNIVSDVVPKQALFDAQVELALVHVTHDSLPNVAAHPFGPLLEDSQEGIS